MKNIKFKHVVLFVLPLLFMAVNVENPAKDLFSTSFGTDLKTEILPNILKLLIGFSGLIAMVYIILGGYQIVTAQGNDEAAKSGKKTLTNAIIGLVVIILAYVIVSVAVNAAFGNLGGNKNNQPPPVENSTEPNLF